MEESGESQSEQESKPKSFWPYVGWGVIGVMITMTLLNFFNIIPPEINRVALPALVFVYLLYVMFRRRKK